VVIQLNHSQDDLIKIKTFKTYQTYQTYKTYKTFYIFKKYNIIYFQYYITMETKITNINIPIKMILATDMNYGIGLNNELPKWKLKGDLRQFKNLTIGKGNNFVLMGNNTWDSMSKKTLVKRKNIILSKKNNSDNNNKNYVFLSSINDVFNYIEINKSDNSELWIIGGSQIYTLFIPYVNEIHWTRALTNFKCSTYLSKEFINFIKSKIWKTQYSICESIESDGYIYYISNDM